MKGWIWLAVGLVSLHFGAVFLTTFAYPTCNKSTRSYRQAPCDCLKSALRGSTLAERFLLSVWVLEKGSETERSISREMGNVLYQCKAV